MRASFVLVILVLCCAVSVHAQDPRSSKQPSLFIRGACILPVSGPPIEGGAILIEGSRIKAVGKDLSPPEGARVLEAKGRVVLPGLIDAGSLLFVPRGDVQTQGSADCDVLDAIDAYSDDLKEVVAAGVTIVAIRPLARGVFNGAEAVLHLRAGSKAPYVVLKRGLALKMSLGVSGTDRSTSAQRYQDFTAAHQAFEAARSYREAWETYRKELAEYQKKKRETEAKKGEDPKTALAKEEPKKPKAPRIDPRNEVLGRALNGELPVHIEAHFADSIEHALSLAEEFKLKAVLEGATEGYLVAPQLAKAKISAILGPIFTYGIPKVEYASHTRGCAAALVASGVEIAIGTLPTPGAGHESGRAGRFLLESAASAVGHGLSRDVALRAITLDAAKILGIASSHGSIEPGKSADLVILSGDPFDASTRVERTIVAGKLVYPMQEE